ncbi:nitrate/nitrite two-component system sensor histidine kinase NarQ [Vibrio sp. ABG19]|uniref:nitrate/nitrite two-component system sensor histidine kinase NarQ n=1 Tax=Vibrio sp. ABG19 TaxID=2817385 RepID=UPI00249E1971|nr:nitrate/nitrite two-component system sensor histidine kinase NarQ [Vibrio sp. ABG19]WGY45190.1 nitrate/nitrite two-component system sensor histidine kinase NarQ [Vibrio sp. ABG19]
MAIQVEKSVTSTIAKSMLLIVLLSVLITGFAIITLASSLNDAEAVNVSGSMRMQSYRLAYDIQSESASYMQHIAAFEQSLNAPSMQAVRNWNVPENIAQDYEALIMRWQILKAQLTGDNKQEYLHQVEDFVRRIDGFVLKLQRFSEQKLINLAWVGGLGLGGVLLISLFVVRYIRKEVVRPLRALVIASEQVQNRAFEVQLDTNSPNELGILSATFNVMAGELGKLYRGLEQAVNEKTHKLQRANQSLEVLYNSAQQLTAARITQDNYQAILRHMVSIQGVNGVKIEIEQEASKPLMLQEGQICGENANSRELILAGQSLGHLYWEAGLPCPDQALIENFALMLARAVYYNRAQKQAEQLLLMEERATIARELHDSLAQSLSYLKIQVSLLKRVMAKLEQNPYSSQTNDIIGDIDQGLSSAYTQLRELLTTFRLTIREANFGQALVDMLDQLADQTPARITLNNNLSSMGLEAHQQVHLMQLIREATMNAIKHADATQINIDCNEQDNEVVVTIEDDGVGFDQQEAKLNHYGMSIMQERAGRLNGELRVEASPERGCKVTLTYMRSRDTHDDEM